MSADVDFAGETPKALAVVPAGVAPGACVAVSAISFFARRTLPWAAVPFVGLDASTSVAGCHLLRIRQYASATLCVHRKPMVAGTRSELCHGSNIATTWRRGHTIRAPMYPSLASAAVWKQEVSFLTGGPDLRLVGLAGLQAVRTSCSWARRLMCSWAPLRILPACRRACCFLRASICEPAGRLRLSPLRASVPRRLLAATPSYVIRKAVKLFPTTRRRTLQHPAVHAA